ncbi:hypothetical protein ALO85_200059 [Pseudomonas syringae pv. aptata]|nr:hypothetical protein ALO85_200059 [Pseudomonas syringae pv. aptata]
MFFSTPIGTTRQYNFKASCVVYFSLPYLNQIKPYPVVYTGFLLATL